MKTQGEIEAAICIRMARFEHEYMGREPKRVRTHLIGDFLVVRLQDGQEFIFSAGRGNEAPRPA